MRKMLVATLAMLACTPAPVISTPLPVVDTVRVTDTLVVVKTDTVPQVVTVVDTVVAEPTTFAPIQTTALTLGTKKEDGSFEPVVTFGLSGNNEGRGTREGQRMGRLHIGFSDTYPAEIEVEPGPNAKIIGNIATQLMLWGPATADGTKRPRMTSSIIVDSQGGVYGVVDMTTNGKDAVAPLLFNVGDGMYYIVMHTDGTIEAQDRVTGKSVRVPLAKIIKAMENLP